MSIDFPLERVSKKKYYQLTQTLDDRMESVKGFVYSIKRNIECQIVPIKDDFGPTRDGLNMHALVGSIETKAGCEMGIFLMI